MTLLVYKSRSWGSYSHVYVSKLHSCVWKSHSPCNITLYGWKYKQLNQKKTFSRQKKKEIQIFYLMFQPIYGIGAPKTSLESEVV
jgi:hypothetical protein